MEVREWVFTDFSCKRTKSTRSCLSTRTKRHKSETTGLPARERSSPLAGNSLLQDAVDAKSSDGSKTHLNKTIKLCLEVRSTKALSGVWVLVSSRLPDTKNTSENLSPTSVLKLFFNYLLWATTEKASQSRRSFTFIQQTLSCHSSHSRSCAKGHCKNTYVTKKHGVKQVAASLKY